MKDFDIDDPEHQKELNKASGRIGATPETRLEWVIRLVQTNLDDLSTGSRLDLACEIYAFSLFSGLPSRSGLLPLNKFRLPSTDQPLEDLAPLSLCAEFPTLETMKKVQLEASNSLCGIVLYNHWHIDRFSIDRVMVGRDYGDNSEALQVIAINTRLEESFKLSLLMTLIAQGGRVRSCPACQQYFRAGRRNQEFCSLTCQTRNATLNYRERHGLITGKPRGRPRKVETKGKSQPKIKTLKTAKKGGSKSGTKRQQ